MIGFTKVHLFENLLKDCLRGKLQDDQERITRALVLPLPLLALGSKSISLGAGFSFVSPGCMIYNLFSVMFFLLGLTLLILSLPLVGLDSKSTFLNPGFCVCIPRQYNTICWGFDLFSGFFC